MNDMKCHGTRGGWVKHPASPVLGGQYGTCFDVSVLYEDGEIKMYFSWRPEKCIALVTSKDGIHFSEPVKCIEPRATEEHWEDRLNRPSVLKKDGVYHMWYTGQHIITNYEGTSQVFHAVSQDGIHFERTGDKPVVQADVEWENTTIMNPDVLWDEEEQLYKMWYSAGSQYEPKAQGYAESKDGLHWTKYAGNPVFGPDPNNSWENHKTGGCQVIKREHDYLMFYIGYFNEDYAQIGIAVSPDGKTNWVRSRHNPIVAPDLDGWDADACYKPEALYLDGKWMLWYNGRREHLEQIGLVIHEGEELEI